jgi:hypothetical protein
MTIMTMNVEHARIRETLLRGGEPATVDPETLFFVESELIEDHLEGTLTPTESELFLSNFLVTEERREHLNEVRMLKRFSSDAFEFDASVFDEPSDNSGKQGSRTITIVIVSAVTVILILIGIQLFRN